MFRLNGITTRSWIKSNRKFSTHFDALGLPNLVDITKKEPTLRSALAECVVFLPNEACITALNNIENKKGNPISVSILAGIMGLFGFALKKKKVLLKLKLILIFSSLLVSFFFFLYLFF